MLSPARLPVRIGPFVVALGLASLAISLSAEEPLAEELKALREQNRLLQEQLKIQQAHIDALQAKVGRIAEQQSQAATAAKTSGSADDEPVSLPSSRSMQAVRIAAEASAAFFSGTSHSYFPHSEFRIEEARVSLEAPVWKDAYFFGEAEILTRESYDEALHLGEFYIEFEGLSRAWADENLLSVRVGRVNVPFGEEYLHRRPSDNPLVSHSASDVWGIDEGIEAYGHSGRWQYVAAVQNGGHSQLHDYTSDKSLTARLGFNASNWLLLSASAMRTGRLAGTRERFSEVWLGNSVFSPFAANAKNAGFQATLFEGDAAVHWKTGSVTLAYGEAHYTDEGSADNARDFNFGYFEAVQHLTARVYGAARYSAIRVPKGYSLAGWSNAADAAPVDRLTRVSLGLGYRFGDPLVLKLEYTWENARYATGQDRPSDDILSSEIAVRF